MNITKLRFKAILFDYLLIVIYLIILFGVTMGIYSLIYGKLPEFNHIETQLISFVTSVLPITIFFTISEAKHPFASFGKRKMGLVIKYSSNPVLSSIIRNILKFLPWQIAHYSIIKGIFQGFDNPIVLATYILSIVLLITYIIMVIKNKNGRHLPDLISRSTVVKNE